MMLGIDYAVQALDYKEGSTLAALQGFRNHSPS